VTAKQLRKTKKATMWMGKGGYELDFKIIDENKTAHVFAKNDKRPKWWTYKMVSSRKRLYPFDDYIFTVLHYDFVGYL
jgi:hypothetical protein